MIRFRGRQSSRLHMMVQVIAIIGGTGPEGVGLALRLALAGERIIIGSRSEVRGRAAADKIRARLPQADVRGAENAAAAREADVIIVTVPYDGHKETLELLRDHIAAKIVIDAVVPLDLGRSLVSVLPLEEGSVAQQAQSVLPQARVAAGFQHINAERLADLDAPLDADVVVCSDDSDAKRTAMALAEKMKGVRALDGGGLTNARYLEETTALLVTLSRIYNARVGVRFTGI
jgi:NADPH-dependent F420 reductase